eukprot:scaffold46691_cov12-Prasinocladus_malaysianus.AAC.1
MEHNQGWENARYTNKTTTTTTKNNMTSLCQCRQCRTWCIKVKTLVPMLIRVQLPGMTLLQSVKLEGVLKCKARGVCCAGSDLAEEEHASHLQVGTGLPLAA